jgi:hypothetical protein
MLIPATRITIFLTNKNNRMRPRFDLLEEMVTFLKLKKYEENGGEFFYECIYLTKDTGLYAIKKLQEYNCGFLACAIGMLPLIRPKEFVWDKFLSLVFLKTKDGDQKETINAEHLGLELHEFQWLFMPETYIFKFKKTSPKRNSSALEIANHIKAFINEKKKQYEGSRLLRRWRRGYIRNCRSARLQSRCSSKSRSSSLVYA